METVKDAIEKRADAKPKRDRAAEVLPLLPPDLPAPLVYGSDASCHFRGGYSLGWSDKDYGRGGYNPAAILARLESHSFTPCETTLVQWDNYRPAPEPFAAKDLPAHPEGGGWSARYEVSDLWPMLPCWVKVNNHTAPEFCAFYLFGGERYSVKLDIPGGLISVSARRIEYRGGWRYDSASAQLRHSDRMHDIRTPDGTVIAQRHIKSHVAAGPSYSEQSAEGALYWEPVVEDVSMTPAQVLAYIMNV